jgi:nicotinate-nucleotide adenylyltransferase
LLGTRYDKSMTEQSPACLSLVSGRRVAFFGGSFDPPHLGHLAVARAARDALQLDRVLFAPVGAQPLKPRGSTAAFDDRVAMTRLAIAGDPDFEISLADAPNATGEPNYTLETLCSLRAALPADGKLFCLMGADSFVSLRRWRGAAEIPFAAALIVASRPGQQLDDLARYLPSGLVLQPRPEDVIVSDAGHSSGERAYPKDPRFAKPAPKTATSAAVEIRSYFIRNLAGQTADFYLLPDLDVKISASEIRKQVRSATGPPVVTRSLLAAPVAAYIRTRALYR